ncbi:MAG: Uma2 family endonuclease [Pseudomonadota bacterium]|nr:Uma2 family endonuclease [Pseudomonadota bacterium]MDP1906233.1 Uma2 family endonuclease [Pseudomonadota bacterium]MDP2353957.1 Uma2 family endonuclease [Pseudomonadota bacterium]
MGNALEKTAEFTPEAYLAWESEQSERHEYLNGEVFLMTGATTTHNVIGGNFLVALRNGLRGKPCRIYMADVKLRVETSNCYFYPDLMVTCSADDRRQPLVQSEPTVVVEVLSDSTAGYDQGTKFAAYRQLSTLREYVLVAQEDARVLVYRRGEGVEWIVHPYGAGETVSLPSLELNIPVDVIYEDVDFDSL